MALKQSHVREIDLVDVYQELTARHATTLADLESVLSSTKYIAIEVEELQSLKENVAARQRLPSWKEKCKARQVV